MPNGCSAARRARRVSSRRTTWPTGAEPSVAYRAGGEGYFTQNQKAGASTTPPLWRTSYRLQGRGHTPRNEAQPVPYEEFVRLRELVRPLAPKWAMRSQGRHSVRWRVPGWGYFGQLFMQNPWTLYARREAWLAASSMPEDVDVFRFRDWPGLILVSQRMVDAMRRLELDGVVFQEVEVR